MHYSSKTAENAPADFLLQIRGHSMTTWTQFCPFLTTTYLNVDIFNPERGQKLAFLDHLPPLFVHVVIEFECPPIVTSLLGAQCCTANQM